MVVILMFLMSAWSIGVMIDRVMAYNAARKQSRAFAPAVAGVLREGELDEAIKIADRYKKSHLAKVVVAGLQEFQAHQAAPKFPAKNRSLQARSRSLGSHRACRTETRVSGLATIGSTAPFVGLFGTVGGIINAFKTMATQKTPGIGAIAGGIPQSAPRIRWLRSSLQSGCSTISRAVSMRSTWKWGNSSSELVDYFLKRSQMRGSRCRKMVVHEAS